MKNYSQFLAILLIGISLWSCSDQIDVELPKTESVVVVDAWLTDKAEPQVIKLKKTIPYFENSFLPGIGEANVTVTDLTNDMVYTFEEGSKEGEYVWMPSVEQPVFGETGHEYQLSVRIGTALYQAISVKNRVPQIDSISYRFEKGNSFFPDSYFAGVFATDFVGVGDSYWIKAWKNGVFLNNPSEINISFDAGGSPGAIVDGIPFIQPVRDGINPFDQDENDDFLPPYLPGDSVYVEVHAINYDSYVFLAQVAEETDRPGGFAELFASPLANVSSNISIAPESGKAIKAIGFFNVASVTSAGRRLDPNNLPPRLE